MSRFWFSYSDPFGYLLAGFIVDSPSVLKARNCAAAAEEIGIGARYCEGYELDRKCANLIPEEAIGRMLNREETLELIQKLERAIPKRAATASVNRRGLVRTRSRK